MNYKKNIERSLHLVAVCALFSLALGCQTPQETTTYQPKPELEAYLEEGLRPFYYGVASGDPLSDRVIIWTHITPDAPAKTVDVAWQVASDPSFSQIVQKGNVKSDSSSDHTIKVDVGSLSAHQVYYYRFLALGATSPVGRTKTAPANTVDSLKFAVVSCSNYEWGYFNAYKKIGERTDLDAVIHLGDYIYEYAPGTYGDTTLDRSHIPARDILTLDDYRNRYAQYRLDPDLRLVHQNHPFITVWDDHEIANNAFQTGAQNHKPEQGSYTTRREIARKVYYEWLPVREGQATAGELYRKFKFGNLASLIMLDERLAGRSAPVDSLGHPELNSEERNMLGEQQLNWFTTQLADTSAIWKIIGNQVIFSYLNWGTPSFNINLDSWDGYPAERKKIADFIRSNNISDVVFVTGDTHSSWALEVTEDPFELYDPESGEGAFAVEFGTTSVNSGNSDERFPADSVKLHEEKITNSPINPHLKYANLRDHGYLLISVYPGSVRANWYYVETVKEPSDQEFLGNSLEVDRGVSRIRSPEIEAL